MQSQSKTGETTLLMDNSRLSSSKNGESQKQKVLVIFMEAFIIERI
jgi:hypothetical protein